MGLRVPLHCDQVERAGEGLLVSEAIRIYDFSDGEMLVKMQHLLLEQQ